MASHPTHVCPFCCTWEAYLSYYQASAQSVNLCVIVGRTVHLLYELNINNQLHLFIGDIGKNKHEPVRVSAMLDACNLCSHSGNASYFFENYFTKWLPHAMFDAQKSFHLHFS